MASERLEKVLSATLDDLAERGTLKGGESVITQVLPPADGKGPRYLLAGEGERPFLRFNSNGYLGLALAAEVVAAEEAAVRAYGTGPGAVRFISGTYAPHLALERRLAAFHDRPAAMVFSSAYATVMGILPSLVTPETAVISDALNHNCIINAVRLARPAERHVYPHLDLAELALTLATAAESCRRAIIVTDGIFSMRGDQAPLDEIMSLAAEHDSAFPENVLVVADDSHGVGAFGTSGRGTEEVTGTAPVDLLIGTLGKAFGVNGGYVVAGETIVRYLRETAPFYIYSNPITPAEAAAALAAVEIVDSDKGRTLLAHLRAMTARLEAGLAGLGFEILPSPHPIVPLLVRDAARTAALVRHLHDHGILATAINYPVVPHGEEEIRFQVSADHTRQDVDDVLVALAERAV
ncbi:MAG: aminotransferase class I/II-fold pyridoxal phosphate-dependent enzyme [Alphaproteobacteria bacterium]|jgi:glycine C-acetyltransferase|nr:aminotransferase class I/II-fold pyridoxal phosphate-dependent enzyme [Alphaproteobacteria bacterium]